MRVWTPVRPLLGGLGAIGEGSSGRHQGSCFGVLDGDAAEQRATDLGLDVLLRGRRPDGTGFTYFDTADDGAGVVLQIRASSPS